MLFCIVIFDRFLPFKDKNEQCETKAFTRGKFQHYRLLLSDEIWIFGGTEVTEQFHLRGWVGVLVDWRNGRRSSEGWGKCRTDEIWDEQTRTVLFILRFAYWLQILRKHTSFFMVNIVVTIIRNFNYGLNRRSRELTIQVVWSRRSDQWF